MNFRDVELLSEYLDGRLSQRDAARLEARLSTDANLKALLEDLRETHGLLRRLPQRRAPRDFRLTPKMAGIKPPEPRAYPAFRFATTLVGLLFVAAVALNAVTPFAAQHLAPAAAPAYGMGGGGYGGAGNELPEGSGPATEAPLQAPFAALAPTATPEESIAAATQAPEAEDTARAQVAGEATEQANKSAPAAPPIGLQQVPTAQQPVPAGWIIALGVLMLVLALAAWWVRTNNERDIRNRWNRK